MDEEAELLRGRDTYELILVTLKLLNAVSGYAGGREKKTLLEVFQWEIKASRVLVYRHSPSSHIH